MEDVRYPNTDQAEETTLPRCQMAGLDTPAPTETRCWWAKRDDDHCAAYPSHLALTIEPKGSEVPSETHVIARCTAAPSLNR